MIISATNPTFSQLFRSPVLLLAFGFGSGLSPKAPGTLGSVAAIPFWLLLSQLPQSLIITTIVVSALAGVAICGRAAAQLGVHDHGGIVWDEFVGLWITMAFLPSNYVMLLVGFLLFRFFDIVKPWPIGWLDKKVSGGLGIMLDDVVAGVAAGACGWLLCCLVQAV
ncbi:MAG: phosphatidylglycerophosphatase A [Porticoccaceae bacterium]|nr:phosphatidylglycerophosphatase A [Porticoccaceae bacterium]MDG2116868.1 phosphatidylglycerophosphatase A [Porticoccaceae bacterium]|tara:strand:- start:114 stop:611 length:498 start_codon:yes stop_codon:yes gene_type:complete